MTQPNCFTRFRQLARRLVTHTALGLLLSGYLCAQVPVVISPVPKLQFFDSSGRTLSFGCVFSYESGTTTPLTTYTDSTGTVPNTNPVVLDAGGFAGSGSSGIWLNAGQAYTLKVVSAGGTNCATGTTQYTIDGIGGGLTILTSVITYSPTPAFPIQAQNQLFEITLTGDAVAQPLTAVGIIPPAIVTFQITQDGAGGHAFTWPSNSGGGATIGQAAGQVTTQTFIWNGSTAEAIGPTMADQVPSLSRALANFAGDINVASDANANVIMRSPVWQEYLCATAAATSGSLRLCKTGSIQFENDAGSGVQGISQDTSNRGVWSWAGGFETTGTVPDLFIGGTSASFPRLKRNATAINFRLGDDSADAPITASTLGLSDTLTSTATNPFAVATEIATPGSPPSAGNQQIYPKAGAGVCAQDSSSVEYCMAKANVSGLQVLSASAGYSCTGDQNVCTFTLTWPTAWADANYTAVCDPQDPSTTSGDQSLANGGHGNQSATTIDVYAISQGTTTKTYSKWVCYGIHN